ncbi:MAG TPA: hypothetical protein PKJ21_08785 [Anaerolineae bacterium]|nr:hypothetical protein [Anaerolineae bacterium]HNT06256.1 hypothetical protein [Anaerolineae bacterium]HOU23813.1 hypothetical protein [Anaerolineae bacterium]HQJ50663.1 hypothetical protein [Anaerolineae bacterium]
MQRYSSPTGYSLSFPDQWSVEPEVFEVTLRHSGAKERPTLVIRCAQTAIRTKADLLREVERARSRWEDTARDTERNAPRMIRVGTLDACEVNLTLRTADGQFSSRAVAVPVHHGRTTLFLLSSVPELHADVERVLQSLTVDGPAPTAGYRRLSDERDRFSLEFRDGWMLGKVTATAVSLRAPWQHSSLNNLVVGFAMPDAPVSVAELGKSSAAGFSGAPRYHVLSQESIELRGRAGVQFQYTLDPRPNVTLRGWQVLTVAPSGAVVVLSMTGPQDRWDDLQPEFSHTVASLRWSD